MTTRPGSCPHPIAKALEAYRARKAVRLYLRLLPVILWRDYGGSGPYTPDQVEAAIARHRVTSREFVPYAIAIFCDADAAERAWRDHRWALDLAEIRSRISQDHFEGAESFSLRDIERMSFHSGSAGFVEHASATLHGDHMGGSSHH